MSATTAANMTLTQAQRQFIECVKALPAGGGRKIAVAARLRLCKWAKHHGYDPIIVLHDAYDMVELEQAAA